MFSDITCLAPLGSLGPMVIRGSQYFSNFHVFSTEYTGNCKPQVNKLVVLLLKIHLSVYPGVYSVIPKELRMFVL